MAKHPRKGWFVTENRIGDRTVAQQMVGLDYLMSAVHGKRVLDVGCAEGLIDFELAKAGAASVHGVEIVATHIAMARELCEHDNVTFEVANADTWAPTERYDIVVLLAILHKLQDPSAACARFVAAADSAVIRLPPTGPVIVDARSGSVPHDIGAAMTAAGFTLDHEVRGTFDEWIGYYTRAARSAEAPPASAGLETSTAESQADTDAAAAAGTAEASARVAETGDATPSVDKPADRISDDTPKTDMTSLPAGDEKKATDDVEAGRTLYPTRGRRNGNKGGSGAK